MSCLVIWLPPYGWTPRSCSGGWKEFLPCQETAFVLCEFFGFLDKARFLDKAIYFSLHTALLFPPRAAGVTPIFLHPLREGNITLSIWILYYISVRRCQELGLISGPEIHFQFEAVGHKEHALDFVVILYFTPSNNFKTGSVRASE
jgi:hypothetical protein